MTNDEKRLEREALRRKQFSFQGGLIHPILGYYYPSAKQAQFVKCYEVTKGQGIIFKNLPV